MTIAKVQALSENITSPEDEVIKIIVVKQFKAHEGIKLKDLSQKDKFLKSALGKGVTYTRDGVSKLKVNKSIKGFKITFEANIEVINDNKIQVIAKIIVTHL